MLKEMERERGEGGGRRSMHAILCCLSMKCKLCFPLSVSKLTTTRPLVKLLRLNPSNCSVLDKLLEDNRNLNKSGFASVKEFKKFVN